MSLNSVENILDHAESGKEMEKEESVRKPQSIGFNIHILTHICIWVKMNL